jgi:hypothetical protein
MPLKRKKERASIEKRMWGEGVSRKEEHFSMLAT